MSTILKPTISQLQELNSLSKETLTPLERDVYWAAIMNHTSRNEAGEMTLDQIGDIIARTRIPETRMTGTRIPKRIWIGKRLYRLLPDFTALTFGEFTALEHFTRTEQTTINELHNILALLTREIKPPYIKTQPRKEPPERYQERANYLQQHATAELAAAIAAFFLQVWSVLYDHTSAKDNPDQKQPQRRSRRTNWRNAGKSIWRKSAEGNRTTHRNG